MSIRVVETSKADEVRGSFLPFWSFVAIQTLRPDKERFQSYATIRSTYPNAELLERFPNLDLNSLPKALYGISKDRAAPGLEIIGSIKADTGRITEAGTDLNERYFQRIAKAGYVYSGFDLAKGPESETPSVALKMQALAKGDRPKIFGVPYDLFSAAPIWSDTKTETSLHMLEDQIPENSQREAIRFLNDALFQATGLNIFEMTQALVHIYNNDAPENANDRNYQDAETFVASRISIPPALVPLIISIAMPDQRPFIKTDGPALLPPGPIPELLEAGEPTKRTLESQIMGRILEDKETWMQNRENPEVLQQMVKDLAAQGFSTNAVKKQVGIMILTAEPWLNIKDVMGILDIRRKALITLQDLPDFAIAERMALAESNMDNKRQMAISYLVENPGSSIEEAVRRFGLANNSITLDDLPESIRAERQNVAIEERTSSIRESTGKKVIDPTTSTEILFDDWMAKNQSSILNGSITVTNILEMFPNLDRGMVRYHIRKNMPESLSSILELDRANRNMADPLDPLDGETLIPMDEINQAVQGILTGNLTQQELTDSFDLPIGAIFGQLFRGRISAEQLNEVREKLRQNTLDHIFGLFKQGLTNGEYRSPASLARQFHISRKSISAEIDARIGDDPYYQELRDRAIKEKWSRVALDTQVGLEKPMGGVRYSSYREAMTGLLLMLYTDYLPLHGINFHVRFQDKDRIHREVDFKLLNEARSEVMWLEYGPPVKALGFHKADQVLYMQSRQELVREDERVTGLTTLRKFASFLDHNFGISLPPEVAKKIGTFENQEVTLGLERALDIKEAIPKLYETPQLVADIFDPERRFHKGLINIFIRPIMAHPEILQSIREIYPEVNPEQFNLDFQEVKNRYQMALLLKRKMFEQSQQTTARSAK
jgi:hypothetical protein